MGFDQQLCQALCREQGLLLGSRIDHRSITDSTNDDALQLARQGAAHGLVVVADEQRRGRGRRGAPWSSAPGKDLTFSIILQGRWPGEQLVLLPLLVGLGVREVVAREVTRPVLVKWPNDVLVEGRKLSGILMESHTRPNAPQAVIVGVGLNVATLDFSGSLEHRATSLALLGARAVGREQLLAELLAAFERRLLELENEGFPAQCRELNRFDALRGRRVRVDDAEGVAAGIAENGGLLLRRLGETRIILAGTVVMLDED